MEPFYLCTYRESGSSAPQAGIVAGGRVAPLAGFEERGAHGLMDVFAEYASLWPRLQKQAEDLRAGAGDHQAAADVTFEVPLQYPHKLMCAAANYTDHAAEMGMQLPDKSTTRPYFFFKPPSTCLIPTGAEIKAPSHIQKLDWEVELAIVIGRRGRNIAREDALSYVGGYTIMNDISARDAGRSAFGADWFASKAYDTFGPTGPWILPAAFVKDPNDLRLRLWVNDTLHQDSSTKHLFFKPDELIAYLSTVVTLEPGDMIATGTPAGVGHGKGVYLQHGDRVVTEIEAIGRIENTVRHLG